MKTSLALVFCSLGFSYTATSLAAPLTTGLPGNWQYKGCLNESANGDIFPYQIVWQTNNTAPACMNQCAEFGFTAAGVGAGEECFCGDISHVGAENGVFGADSECNIPCPGNNTHSCGGEKRLNTYYWPNLTMWQTPANIGRYEYLVPGVVVPIFSSVSINNKVLLLEKYGSGPLNSTGAYELDLTLVNDFPRAYRVLHTKTDLFCSANIILPDKKARQLTVAGWSGNATFGVRFYTPDGLEGVNGTNDIEENNELLRLQRGRWYNSAVLLSNGSVMTIGGTADGDFGPIQANLEVLPKPEGGDTVVNLDWLAKTIPNNLYPFVTILPSTRIFIGHYNEARILDPATFATVSVLPNIPGAVNNSAAGRNYPLSGAHVPLPQFAPYTDPLKILICGGTTPGDNLALDNCVSIAPEAQNPTWTIERMPSRRVLPCMLPLPDGTIFIVNGAQAGRAGWGGLSSDPNFNAVLYNPTLPLGERFSILNKTDIARMYHSEAILLPDGRILISGSDPQDSRFPEEYRIEAIIAALKVYIPPYLNQGFKQPTFTLPTNDWAYGGSYSITGITLFQGTTETLRVSLIAAFSSTHSNAMGARTLFPAFSCSGTSCTIVAPPNAGVSPPGWHQLFILDGPTPSHSQWVRIGGDPSNLGNWPNLPGFTPPGV